MSIQKVAQLSKDWERPDMLDKYLTMTTREWQLYLAQLSVEVAVKRAEEATRELLAERGLW